MDRRDFVKTTGSAAMLGAMGLKASAKAQVMGANDRVRIAVCGVRGRGFDHIKGYSHLKNVEIVALCDVDENVLSQRLQDTEKLTGRRPQGYGDIRKLLEDKSIDAISVATPNHWHSLIGIWTCQAGKDLYVEKPCSHNIWEGKQLVKAVKKYNRICQHGSQSRSMKGMVEGINQVKGGLIGEVYMARGLCFKWRPSIGHTPVSPVPAGVNYDLWTGPAPLHPFSRNRFHYNWHWFWDTGNGDLGNQGIHEVDIARWGLGVDYPTKVTAIGGKFLWHDDQETPNVLNCAYEFETNDGKKRMMEFEVRGWMTNHEAEIGTGAYHSQGVPAAGLQAGPKPKPHHVAAAHGPSLGPPPGPNTIGNIFYGSKGYIGMDGYESYRSWLGEQAEPGPSANAGGDHFLNFIDCVRSRRSEDLHCPIEEGLKSVILVHLANASYNFGRTIQFDPDTQEVVNDPEAAQWLRGTYRKPYVVPEQV